MLRITGGVDKGMRIAPIHTTVRPTMERVRIAFFNSFEHHISMEGITVLDLFGGSGIMGLEALSRGALSVTVCEKNRAVFRCIQQCYHTHRADTSTYRLCHMPAERFVDRSSMPFNLVIIDPPYNYRHYEDLLNRIRHSQSVSRSIIAVFHRTGSAFNTPYPVLTENRYGDTTMTLLGYTGSATTAPKVSG